MNDSTNRRRGRFAAATFALVATLHAPLHAEEAVAKTTLDRPELVLAMAAIDQKDMIRKSAEQALRDAHLAMQEELAIELAQKLGNNALSVAANRSDRQ